MELFMAGASMAGKALARPLTRKIVEGAIGTPLERQLTEACTRAITGSLGARSEEDQSQDLIAHQLDLIRRLIDAAVDDPLDLILMADGFVGWQKAADKVGIDLGTLADDPQSLLGLICRRIPEEIAVSAGRDSSALFGPFVVRSLLQLTRQLGATSQLPDGRSWAIAPTLADALATVAGSNTGDLELDTPSLLLALLLCRTEVTATLLDRVSSGIQLELISKLELFRSGPAAAATRKLTFVLRPEYRIAQEEWPERCRLIP